MRELSGVICATLTPFTSEHGGVDEGWIAKHLRFLEQHGVSGVLALGTTGEAPSMSLEERKRVLDVVLEQRGGLSVIAGTGCAALPETIALSRYALERGADAVLVVPPFYFKDVPEAGLLTYYRAVCDALPDDARLLLYHIPQVTAVPISPGVIEGLLQSHRRKVYGLKDSSGDMLYLTALLQDYPRLRVFVGSETQAANGLIDGAAGMISALSNTWPDLVGAVWKAHQEQGDIHTAQGELTKLFHACAGTRAPLLKAALPWVSDLPRTSVRAPLSNLSEAEAEHLRDALARLDLV
jgi:4-hydroxy-tetrahydrodipicolinate synthase